MAIFAVSAASSLAAPYKYEKAQSEELSKTVPGGAFQEPWSPVFDGAGNLFVVDSRGNAGKGIVDKFNDEDAFQAQLGSEAFTEEFLRSVAVNDETGHLYAGELGFFAEPPFSDVIALSGTGEKLSQWDGANTPSKTFGEGCCFLFTAVDNSSSVSKGDVYVATPQAGGRVDVFEPQNADKEEGKFVRELEAPEGGFAFEGQGSIAIDNANGEVYVVDAGHKVIDRYSPTGELEAQIEGPSPSERFKEPVAVAVDATSGDVFVIDHVANVIDKLSPGGELLAQIKETGPNELLGHPVGLAVQQSGPHAGELYVADAEKKAIDIFAEEVPGAPLIEAEGVQKLSEQSASFVGEIDPRGAPTEYRFEYGPCSSPGTCAQSPYPQSIPIPDGSLGAEDFTAHPVGPVKVQGLSPATSYHFRLIAHNANGEVPGEERVFTTQGAGGGAFALADGRAWELVSPPNKFGAVLSGGSESGVVAAAADGSAVSYLANGPTEASPPGAAGSVQVLSRRGAGGWSSRDIATPHVTAPGEKASTGPEYRFFSEDLSSAVVQPFGLFNPALSPEASEQTAYLAALGGCTSGCLTPLVTGKAGFSNVPAGTQFGEEQLCEENNGIHTTTNPVCGPEFLGATPNAGQIVLRSAAPLVEGVPRNELYEWSAGHLELLSILPENEAGEEPPAPTGPELSEQPLLGSQYGLARGTARRAVSSDGSRVFFESGGALYMRDTAKAKTLQIDAREAGCPEGECEAGAGRFQIASADGSRVYFTDTRRLSKDAGAKAKEPDLYECVIGEEPSGKLSCALSDLTPLEGGESANVQGDVLGASEDGSSIYFVADGALAGSGAGAGGCVNNGETKPQAAGARCNLYLRREGQAPRLVASLSGGDAKVWTQLGEHQLTRVSPDGQYLAFMSERPLTGYDNTDAVSGRADAEVFRYDASGAGQLSCASCDPSGARPHGVEYRELVSGQSEVLPSVREEWEASGWVAALLPHTSAFTLGEPNYQSRYLSDSGRLFFNALDALAPQDVNGTGDVYEYEPQGYTNEEGTQQCTEGTSTFAGRSAGCIGLISSGTSSERASFLDASQSGGDVFFLTASKLTPEDIDTREDVYDAHECTAKSPCIPPAAVPPPPCNTEASCKPSPTPQPSIFGLPASATFSGAGNLTPPAVVKAKAKPLTRAQKLAKALAVCHREKKKARRSACVRHARKEFGQSTKKKARK